jgi:hypothetical protein
MGKLVLLHRGRRRASGERRGGHHPQGGKRGGGGDWIDHDIITAALCLHAKHQLMTGIIMINHKRISCSLSLASSRLRYPSMRVTNLTPHPGVAWQPWAEACYMESWGDSIVAAHGETARLAVGLVLVYTHSI